LIVKHMKLCLNKR